MAVAGAFTLPLRRQAEARESPPIRHAFWQGHIRQPI